MAKEKFYIFVKICGMFKYQVCFTDAVNNATSF